MSKILYFFCLTSLLLYGMLCAEKKSFAQGKNDEEIVGISVDQSALAFDLAPGEERKMKINVGNTSSEEQRMSAETQDFSIGENNEVSFIDGDNEIYGMRSWVKVPTDPWLLDPGSSKEIECVISVPKDAIVGSHYAAVMLRAFPKINVDNFQKTIVSGRIGVYVLVNVLGDKSGTGKLTKFEAPLIADKKVAFNAEFANDGTVHYIPHGEINIRNFLTRKTETINLEKHFVFPGKKYSFATNWDVRSLFGIYVAEASFTDGDGMVHQSQRMIFGKYSFITLLGLVSVVFVIMKTGYVFYRKKRKA